MKILTVVGARPQFVKAATVSRCLRDPSFAGMAEVIVHTGQHYDVGMSQRFFEELDIPAPTYNLGVGSGSHGVQTGAIMARLEEVLQREVPDWMLVYGDTNSTLAAALVAAKAAIRLAHVEAGLRSFRRGMPEEVNRIVTDRLSDLLFCPTEHAREQLTNEGRSEGVHLVGDVMYDGFCHYSSKVDQAGVLRRYGLQGRSYALATLHRAENTDDPQRLAALMHGLADVGRRMPVVLPLHPRTQKVVETGMFRTGAGVQMIAPLPYLEMLALLLNATVVITDSGGVQKEAYFARVPCVTLRDETEWAETLEHGWNRLAPPGSDIATAAEVAAALPRDMPYPDYYGDGHAATRILRIMAAAR